jgi:hypothetical protein
LRRKASRTCQREERRLIPFRLSATQIGYRLMSPNGVRARVFDMIGLQKMMAARRRLRVKEREVVRRMLTWIEQFDREVYE